MQLPTPERSGFINFWEQLHGADNIADFHYHWYIFFDVPGGIGKTYVINAMQNCFKVKSKIVVVIATSAVAAKFLKEGKAANSAFRILVLCSSAYSCYISVNSQKSQKLRDMFSIICDKSVMCQRHFIECLDRTLEYIMQSLLHFGGKVLLLSGDLW